MTLIKERDALDIYLNNQNTISTCPPDLENFETGKSKDGIVTIRLEDIDTGVSEPLHLKKEYYDQLNEEFANE